MLFDALHALKCKNFMFLKVFAVVRTVKSQLHQNIRKSCMLVQASQSDIFLTFFLTISLLCDIISA